MHHWLVIATLVVLSSGCIPSNSVTNPVTTTTAASTNVTTTASVTTTTISSNTTNTTTTTTTTSAPTTTTVPNNCCAWPITLTGVNTVDPRQEAWSCNQTITFTCSLISNNTQYVAAGVYATNAATNVSTIISSNIVNTMVINCSPTFSWYVGAATSTLYSYFACAYRRGDGSYVIINV